MPVPQLPVLPPDAELEMCSARLKQIPMREEHAEAMFPLLSDESLYAFTGGSAPASVESLAATYLVRESRRSRDGAELWLNWMIWHATQRAAVGYTQSTVHPTHAEVAWVVGTRWQGQGYATEAATAMVGRLLSMGVRDIRACVHPAHLASRRVAEKLGLQLTDRVIDGEQVWVNRAH